MNRRAFIAALGGLMSAYPIVGRAQQANRLPAIGYLGASTATGEKARTDAFVERLRELGWVEGGTVNIHYRWGQGQPDRMSAIAAEFIRLNVDVILAAGTAPALACKQATAVIPIVFGLAGDPLGTGLVAGLARPGGNVTGLSNQAADLASKRLEILRELIPKFKQLAVLAHAEYPGRKQENGEIEQAARTLGLQVDNIEVRSANDIAPVMDKLRGRCDALYVIGDPFLNSNRVLISTLAKGARLPTMYVHQGYVEAGGLVSYGANIPDMFRRAAEYVDKILRGVKPADLPVEQPTKFDLAINLTTAKAIDPTVPPTLLARADEVIE